MKISILKWDEVNAKSDAMRTPNWLRINQEIGISQSLFNLNSAEKWVWILLLATRCKAKKQNFEVNIGWFCSTFNVAQQDFDGAVKKLSDSGTITVDCQETDSSLTPNRPTYITEHTEQNIQNVAYAPVSGEPDRTQEFIAAYCRKFKTRWGVNPEIKGKNAGIAKRLAKGWSRDRAEILLDAFFSMPDAHLVKSKHPLTLLEYKLNEVTVYADSGKFTTNREAHQADNLATNVQLLQKVREGKV